ncbi:MAG: lysylphosphatidylglycerol synthase transmembrane domain-containing protein [Candidatus Latescibacterota bacterium]
MRRALSLAAKVLVSCALLAYLASRSDLRGVQAAFARTDLSLFGAAVLLFVASNCLGAAQWFLLLRAQDLPVSFRQSLVLYFVGVFFNNVLLGNIGGDALRIYDVRRLTGRGSAAVAATVMDRFIGLFSTCSLALVAYPLIAGAQRAWLVSALVPVWLGLVAVLAVGLSRRVGGRLQAMAQRVLPAAGVRLVASLLGSVSVYRHRAGLLCATWLISLVVQMWRILVYWYAGLSVGMDAALVYYVCFQPVAAILAALPVSIGGLGVREGTLVGLFASTGAEHDVTLAMSLLGYVAGIAASLLGGLAFVVRRVEPGALTPEKEV